MILLEEFKICYKKWSLKNCGDHYRDSKAGTQKMIVGMRVFDFKTDVPMWQEDHVYVRGDRVRFERNVYNCTYKTKNRPLQPGVNCSTWTRIYDDHVEGETYSKGQEVSFEGFIVISLTDNNKEHPRNNRAWEGKHGELPRELKRQKVTESTSTPEDEEAYDQMMKGH